MHSVCWADEDVVVDCFKVCVASRTRRGFYLFDAS